MKILSVVWAKLDGYKTYLGLLITMLAFLAQWVPEAMGAAHADPDLIAKIAGGITTVLGLIHKLAKVTGAEAK